MFVLELLALQFITLYIFHLREAQRYKHIPGRTQFFPLLPFKIPFFNPIPYFELSLDGSVLIPFLLETGKQHNTKVVKITHFLWTKVFVWGPEELKVMTKDFKRFTKSDFFKFPLGTFGENVLVADGDEWKRHRQVVNGAFSTENLEFLSKTTNNSMELLFDQLEKKAEDKIHIPNVHETISNVTMDIMTKSLFGRDFGVFSDSSESKEIAKKLDSFVNSTQLRFILPKFIFQSQLLSSLLPGYNRGVSEFKQFLDKLLSERSESRSESRKHLFATLLEANDKFHDIETSYSNESESAGQAVPKVSQTLSDDELLSNTLIFFFAGNDTTSSAMQWLLYRLARHQHVQKKMIDEIEEIIGSNQPDHDDFHKLKYCQQVLHETLRHHPPFMFGFRYAGLDEQTNSAYLTVAEGHKSNKVFKGTPLMMMYQATHFDPEVWRNPHEFIPERFEALSKIKPTQMMSFSAGPRKCVGMNFSYRQQMIMIVRMLQRYTLHLPAGHQQIEADISRPTQIPYKFSLELVRR